LLRIAIDPIFPPPPVPNSKKHQIPDAMDNRFELVYNDRDDAAELKNLPIGKLQPDSLFLQTTTCTASSRKRKWRMKVVMEKLKLTTLRTDETALESK